MLKHRILLITLLSFLSFFKNTQAQDWPNLAKYQKANDQLKNMAPDDNRVVFMGNSITEGWTPGMPSFFDNPSYINRGISGTDHTSNAASIQTGCD